MNSLVHELAVLMRRAIAAAAVLILSGLLPLAATAGLCAMKPCCHAHRDASPMARASDPKCCSETNCDAASSHVDATASKTMTVHPTFVATPAAQVDVVVVARLVPHDRLDTGPPPTRQRLATLSILLI